MKLRRLSTPRRGFDAELAALTRYDAAQDAGGAGSRARASSPTCARAATRRCSRTRSASTR